MLARREEPRSGGAPGPLTLPRKGRTGGREAPTARAGPTGCWALGASPSPPGEPGARFRVVWRSRPSAHTGVSGSPGSQSECQATKGSQELGSHLSQGLKPHSLEGVCLLASDWKACSVETPSPPFVG